MPELPKSKQEPVVAKGDHRKPYDRPPPNGTLPSQPTNTVKRLGHPYSWKISECPLSRNHAGGQAETKEDGPLLGRMKLNEDGIAAIYEAISKSPSLSKLPTQALLLSPDLWLSTSTVIHTASSQSDAARIGTTHKTLFNEYSKMSAGSGNTSASAKSLLPSGKLLPPQEILSPPPSSSRLLATKPRKSVLPPPASSRPRRMQMSD